MCGIVGVINGSAKVKTRLGSIMNDMLWADQLRGQDGGGVFWYDNKIGKYDLVKDKNLNVVLNNNDFTHAKAWFEDMPFMVGHNRAATRGSVTSDNNHPFDEGNVVLVHNGTMTHIPKEFDDGTKVDSHAIAKMLHKASPQIFMKKSLGAYALVWFDKVSRNLNLLRNKERPLSLVYFEDFVLISSEPGLGVWAGSRYGFPVVKVEDVKPLHLYEFSPFDKDNPIITDLSDIKCEHFTTVKPYVQPNYAMACQDPAFANDVDALFERAGDLSRQRRKEGTLVTELAEWRAKSADAKAKLFETMNPWTFFEQFHGLPKFMDRKKVDTPKPAFAFKVGDKLSFEITTARTHEGFSSFSGSVPNTDPNTYQIRGNVPLSVDKVMASQTLWKGTISEILPKHGKITVWVKEVEGTSIAIPEEPAEKQQ